MPEAGFRQVLLLRWKPGAALTRRAEVLAAALALSSQVPEVISVSAGEDRGTDDTWDAVISIDFQDEAGWRRYLEHPAHRSFVAEHSVPTISERAVIHCDLTRWQRSSPPIGEGSGVP